MHLVAFVRDHIHIWNCRCVSPCPWELRLC